MIRLDVERHAGDPGRLAIRFDRLSKEQAGALVSDREVAVSAGAGAGKTSTLAARFVTLLQRLVDEGTPDIADVLVLTFTEKAAQEMRERCYAATSAVARQLRTDADRLAEAGLSERARNRLRARWEALRDRFAGAAISTFHGFCARVLREFPAETATPPGFTILEEGDAAALVLESATDAVDHALVEAHPSVGLLLHTFGGRAALVDVVATLLRARGEVEPTLRAHHEGRIGEADLLARAPLSPDAARAFLRDEWRPFADNLLTLTAGIETSFLAQLAEVRLGLAELPADPFAVYEAYATALQVVEGSNGVRSLAHHTATGKKADWGPRHAGSREPLQALQEQLAGWIPRIGSVRRLPNRHDRTLLEVLAALGGLVIDAVARHGVALRAAGGVDFTELQLRVRAAFAEGGAIATELRRRHRFVMVDEFQDTDGLQWSIVEALSRPSGPGDDRLFFVGDVKQAIYGFRGGDVQVFNAARRTVAHAVELSTNYRSRPELIDFFNRLFADVLGPDTPERPTWEAPFAALAAGRKDTGGTVRVATYERPGTDAVREAGWIAGLLKDEVLAEQGAYAGLGVHDLVKHPAPPIAILLRRRRHLLTYEAALRARGIPYVVVGGVGFWSRPEVIDIANVLHALVRRDDISLVGALRSPLFGLTDQDLWELAASGVLHDYAEADLPPELARQPRIVAAQSDWRALARLRDHLSVAELVHAVLLRTRQAWAQGFSAPGGRGAANLDRLLSLADRFEQRGATLDAFAAHLVQRVEADAADAEAAVADTTARVAILTVHASKGLEYPVVVLPDLGAKWAVNGDAGGVLRRRVGDRWELACAVPDRHADIDQHARPGLLGILRAHGAEVEAAEARRLFYVACTRARDHLVLVGARRAKAPDMTKAGSWSDLQHAHEALHPEDPAWLTRVVLDDTPPVELPPLVAPPLAPPPADLARRLAPVSSEARVEVSPSSLALFASDPDAWFQRHVLRIPELALGRATARAEGVVIAGVRGEVLHSLLEDNLLDDDTVARARWEAMAHGEGLDTEAVARGWPTVEDQLRVLRTSPDVAAVLAAHGFAELKVRMVRGAVTLDGRVDRLCRDPVDGAWMVIDYKSVRASAEGAEVLAEHRDQLLAYSVAASRVLEANNGERVARAGVLLTRTGRLHRLPDWTPADYAELDTLLESVAARLAEVRG
ncbi:MAG: UvrD-helicase domain-containing protein [Pseudomonadota bacterium]|nr:UvrD-helicase domain-containing protein [Pseudomonadota bacterium]